MSTQNSSFTRKTLSFLGVKIKYKKKAKTKKKELCYEIPWHLPFIHDVMQRMDCYVKGKRFLEFCNYNHYEMPLKLLQEGATQVDCVDPWNKEEGKIMDGIYSYKKPVYDTSLPDETYDCVYGIALLEHISKIDEFAAEIYRILKPGGRAILQGGNLYGSDWGHHITAALLMEENDDNCSVPYPENIDKCNYCVNNTLTDWGYIYLNKQEQLDDLLSKGIPLEHAKFILDRVHNSLYLSRHTASEIIEAFKKQKLILSIRRDFLNPISDELYKKFPQNISKLDASTRAITIYAEKILS